MSGVRLTRFFFNEILQISKLKFFVLRDKFSKITQIFLKFANVEHHWKIQKLKNSLKNSWKICTSFGCQVEKLVSPLACWHPKFNNGYTFSTLARSLARWQIKIRSWHAFGTLAYGHIVYTDTHGKYDMRFSKLIYALWKCKCDHENCN